MERTINMKLEERLEGAIGERGKFTGYTLNKKGLETKGATYEYQHIDWEKHLSGQEYFGISPVKIINTDEGRKGLCRWIAWDLDFEEKPKDICRNIFRMDSEVIIYHSSSFKFHLHKYFDEWIDVEEAHKLAKAFEEKLKKVFKKGVDTSHTLPSGYTIPKGKPGGWLFMPYGTHRDLKNKETKCLSPRGNPLSKSQCEFRITWRKHLLISSSVGLQEGEGGRANFLFYIAQEIKHNNLDLTLEEVNSNFNDPLDDLVLSKEIRHIEKSLEKEEYDKAYFDEHYETYLYKMNGYYRNKKSSDVLAGFLNEDQEKETQTFLQNVIYQKEDDKWYDKSTGCEYKQKSIQITYGHIYGGKISEVITNFVSFDNAQLVETSVYRPDLFKSIEDPIIKDEKGLLQLNNYRPSDIKPLEPVTNRKKHYLNNFKELVKRLTENEGVGTDSKGKEVKLYDYVLDHLSLPFQQPGNKIRSAVLFHSEHYQVGKNTLFEMIRLGLGKDNCTIITPENAVARERNFLENQLVLIDEILIDGDYKKRLSTLNILKPLMTQELHDSRPLFKNWRQVHSTCNMMLFTNFKNAISVKNNEARYTIIDVGKTRDEMGGDEFFNLFWNTDGTIVEEYPEIVKWFLSTRQISPNFNPKSISLKTKFLETMSKEGGHPLLPEIEPLFKEGATPFHQTIINIREAFDWLKKEKNIPGRINDFADALKILKCERVGECFHKKSGKKPTLYIIKNFEFFCDKSMSRIANDYWLPIGKWANGVQDYSMWGLTSNDVSSIGQSLKEIEAYEDFHRGTPEEDPEEDFETIRRQRKAI